MLKICKNSEKYLMEELQLCCGYFYKEANWEKDSPGYGLVRDKSELSPEIASISAVGFGLAALITAVKHGWITEEEAYKKADGTLNTFLNNIENTHGFFYHFVNMNTGEREWDSELSIIDTGIFICGAITAGEFFGKEVKEKADKLYRRVNWRWFVDESKDMFYLGHSKEKGFFGNWDVYAEQLILYILGAGSPTFNIDKSLYDKFKKPVGEYNQYNNIIHSWFGSLFTYQFSHAWVDFRDTKDENNINWFDNSVRAILANRQFCIDNKERFKTFGKDSWGITACVYPKGYTGENGAFPASTKPINDGTIAPYGAVSSIVFTPDLALEALKNYYENIPGLVGEYGLKAAFNLEKEIPWVSRETLGIEKGITLTMIENYLNETIWKNFMKNKHVQKGMETLGINKSTKK